MTEPQPKKTSLRDRWPLHERRQPRPPMSRRLGLILWALALLFVTGVFFIADNAGDKADNEIKHRQNADIQTSRIICDRQDTGLRLSYESRQFIATNDRILQRLIALSVNPKAIEESEAQRGPLTERQQRFILVFRKQAAKLGRQVKRIEKTREELKGQINALDCNQIPPPEPKDEPERVG